jgi:hypothetical protein
MAVPSAVSSANLLGFVTLISSNLSAGTAGA